MDIFIIIEQDAHRTVIYIEEERDLTNIIVISQKI